MGQTSKLRVIEAKSGFVAAGRCGDGMTMKTTCQRAAANQARRGLCARPNIPKELHPESSGTRVQV